MELIDTLQSISKLYYSDKLDGCCINLKLLLSEVTNDVKSNLSSGAYKDFYDVLLKIVKAETINFSNCTSEKYYARLELLTLILKCIRNSFYKSPIRQNYVVSNEFKVRTLLEVFDAILICYSNFNCAGNDFLNEDCKLQLQSLNEAATASITCFVNMMAGQSSVRKTLWPYLKHKFKEIFFLHTPEINCLSAALLHQFLLEDELLPNILTECDFFIPVLLNIYAIDTPEACYSLFCLKIFLSSSIIAASSWKDCSGNQCLLFLDILSSFIVENSEWQIQPQTLEFFQMLFKKDADIILSNQDKVTQNINPVVMHRLLGFLCTAASSNSYQHVMQKDKSLLISTLYMLKSLTLRTEVATESHLTIVGESSFLPEIGFKRDIIRLLACLVYKNKSNQDFVGELDGVSLLLVNSQHDDNNPLIRETCIFALRNLLEGNEENQKVVTDLELRGVAQNQTLEKLGMRATVQEGKITLSQIP